VWPHSSYHDSELKSQWKSIKVNTILLKLSDGYRKPTDVEMSDKKHVEKKNQTENCIMWLHLYSKLLLFKLLHMLIILFVEYQFSWFLVSIIKPWNLVNHEKSICNNLNKRSLHLCTSFLLSTIIKYIPHVCHGWRFGIHLCTSFLLSTIIKYIPHVCHGWRFGPIRVNIYIELNFLKNCLFVRFTVTTRQLEERSTKTYTKSSSMAYMRYIFVLNSPQMNYRFRAHSNLCRC
jgi:hypothetical protein